MSDAVRRAIRTFVQAFFGVLATSGIFSAAGETGVVDWSGLKRVGISAAAAGVVALFSYAQNALEDAGTIPAALKAPASDGANPT